MVPWNSARTKVQIKLSIQRLRTLQEKKHALAKKSRREIADLLLKNRVETARLRVEGLIGDDIYVELLELLELYSELLQARFNLLDASSGAEPEPSISDAVCAIVYAAPRTELKELQILREMLMHKYGRNFSLTLVSSEPPPQAVPARVASKLALYTPARELVDAYLYEIAKGYNVAWEPEPPASEPEAAEDGIGKDESEGKGTDDEASGGGGGGAIKEGLAAAIDDDSSPPPPKTKSKAAPKDQAGEEGEEAELPAAPTYPAGQEKDVWAADPVPKPAKKLTEEEELAQRFERLKKLK